MARLSEAEIEDLKSRNPCDAVAGRWVKLRRSGQKMIGPCPICSSDPTSRDATRFEATAAGWVCAVCADGGDVIRLVQRIHDFDFSAAVDFLGGVRAIDPEEAARAERYRAEQREKRDRESRQFREKERRRLWGMWDAASAPAGTEVARYLSLRAIDVAVSPARLRFMAMCPMYADGSGKSPPVHRGPAMLAAIVGADGRFAALHTTWLDLTEAKGKALVRDPATGEILPAKKVRGSKAGGHIELLARSAPRRLIIGEGIETVLSVWTALERAGWDLGETAFWSSVDLGNLGGRARETVRHPTLKTEGGRVQRVPGPEPDLEAPGLVIPESVDEIILLGDGDSDRFLTACALVRAARRFAQEGRVVKAAWAPDDADFNDLIRAPGGAEKIADLILTAGAPIVPDVASGDVPLSKKPARVARADSSSLPVAADPASSLSRSPSPAPPPAAVFPAEKDASSQMGGSATKQDGRKGAGRRATKRRGAAREDLSPEEQAALDLRLAFFPLTDLGNAERFRERYRGRLIWCQAIGWLWWDGRRWSREGADDRVGRAEHETVRSIQDEADALVAADQDMLMGAKRNPKGKSRPADEPAEVEVFLSDVLRGWGRASESAAHMAAIAKHAAKYLAVQPTELDANPYMINVLNGTLVVNKDVKDGDPIDWIEHDPANLITKLAPVEYDPDAACPLYDTFIAEVQPKPENRRFLHQWKGLSLTGDTSEQRLCVFWGKGRNGKSVTEDTHAFVAGDYSETVPIETFLAEGRGRNAGQATPDLAILPGVRMLRTSEPKRNAALDEALIKLSTGGEPIIARHLNRDYFKFYPAFKLTISGNYRPQITGSDEGIWRRIILFPWSFTVPKEKIDRMLSAKLRAEASGILNRLLDGIRDWIDHGLVLPDDVDQATQEYRSDSDPLGRFLTVCVAMDPDSRVQSSDLHELFCAWAKANSATEWSPKGLAMAMKERGFHIEKSSVSYWRGVRLKAKVSDFVDQHGKPHKKTGGGPGAPPDDGVPPVDDDEVFS